ncbi:MAG: nucleotide sugar dehydrogenase [Phycisphaeraceae bacterium]|nr:nucleotide sugar dehydrogenase [Phycisphaeraceae bacterium]
MDYDQTLASRVQSGQALIGVIGLGYVGLPLAHALHEGGHRILGFDTDARKVESLNLGKSYIKHLGDSVAQGLSESGRFEATVEMGRLHEPDVLIVCVPTPLGEHQEPDLSYVVKSARDIGRVARPGQLAILESTTYPGTTRDEFAPALVAAAAEAGTSLKIGEDFFIAYSPEREDPGRKSHTTRSTPKLVGGLEPHSARIAAAVYRRGLDHVIEVSSAEVAESAKLMENIFRAVNIAMVNEMKVLLSAMNIDIWEVIGAASTKPFGYMPFQPGPGLGGHCIPIDPFYLTWKAKEYGKATRFIELAGEINTSMPRYVVEQTAAALNRAHKPVAGSRILILGLAYKADIDDPRESPSFELIRLLRDMGAHVDYSDPHIPATWPARKHDLAMKSVPLAPESVASYDAVIIATAHKAFDYTMIAECAQLVVDTRNAMARHAADMQDRLVKA